MQKPVHLANYSSFRPPRRATHAAISKNANRSKICVSRRGEKREDARRRKIDGRNPCIASRGGGEGRLLSMLIDLVSRSVGRSAGAAKFAEIYSPENRRERIHVLGMRPPARSPVKTAANSKFMTLFGVHNCRRRAASQRHRHRWLHPALSPILNTYADPEDGGRCRSVGRRQLRSTHSTLLPLLP